MSNPIMGGECNEDSFKNVYSSLHDNIYGYDFINAYFPIYNSIYGSNFVNAYFSLYGSTYIIRIGYLV